jgi:hypothetical protein
VVLCLPEYSSRCPAHDQHGRRLPSTTYWVRGSSSSAVGTNMVNALFITGVSPEIAREMVDCETS